MLPPPASAPFNSGAVPTSWESILGPIFRIGNTNSRLRFPPGPREFANRWRQEGPTHHCALGVGHVGELARKLSELTDIPLVGVCRR